MRGGALPPALLSTALGFSLAFAPRTTLTPAILVFVGSAVVVRFMGLGALWPDAAFMGCWASIVLIAASIHLPAGVGAKLAMVLALDAGVWAGAVTSASGAWVDLAIAIPCVLIVLPSAWMVARGHTIIVKVAGSWLIAVAVLAAGLSFVPTPGYVPDHME